LEAFMARLARIVVPQVPHHVTQRGNRRQQTFFQDGDYQAYLELMAEWCAKEGVQVWAYCLMPNHVHLIAVPGTAQALGRAIGETHRRYTRRINARKDWTGYLWQGRFGSCAMDEIHTLAAARYIELNPVRAKLVRRAQDYRWSSAAAHLAGHDDRLVRVEPLLERVANWRDWLSAVPAKPDLEALRKHARNGRPLGDEAFVSKIEVITARRLRKAKPGPKPRA
jgi:putative transposase